MEERFHVRLVYKLIAIKQSSLEMRIGDKVQPIFYPREIMATEAASFQDAASRFRGTAQPIPIGLWDNMLSQFFHSAHHFTPSEKFKDVLADSYVNLMLQQGIFDAGEEAKQRQLARSGKRGLTCGSDEYLVITPTMSVTSA